MKKILIFIMSLCIILSNCNVYASTKTYDRTEDNLRVPSYSKVDNSNMSNILLTPAVDASEKIYDFADLYTESEEDMLLSKVSSFIEQTNLDLAIVTTSYNNKNSAQVYADDFYDYNEFGIGERHSGLLFLIDMHTRNIYITTTGSAIDTYSDERNNTILENVFRFMSESKFYEGTTKFIDLAASYANISLESDKDYIVNDKGELVKDNSGIFIAFGVSVFITVIVLLIMVSMNKMVHKACSSREYLVNSTKRVNKIKDVFLGSHVSKVRINNDSSGGSGGSSIHMGSSGSFHGGGGHKF